MKQIFKSIFRIINSLFALKFSKISMSSYEEKSNFSDEFLEAEGFKINPSSTISVSDSPKKKMLISKTRFYFEAAVHSVDFASKTTSYTGKIEGRSSSS